MGYVVKGLIRVLALLILARLLIFNFSFLMHQ